MLWVSAEITLVACIPSLFQIVMAEGAWGFSKADMRRILFAGKERDDSELRAAVISAQR